jgi:ABC-2 type transport system ATP-binding protein
MVGLVHTNSGSISYDEHELKKDRHWIKQNCGYAPEDAELLPYLTGKEYLELLASIYKVKAPEEQVDYFLELTGLKEQQSELVLNYSHGMKQKLSMVAALIGDPSYVIMDEALNGMDPLSLYRIKKYLSEKKNRNATIVITSHIIPLIQQWCNPIVIMHKGKILKEYTRQDVWNIEKEQNKTFEEHFVELIVSDGDKD